MLSHAPWAPPLDGARIIDLFAGAGALGIEALSRGGRFCLFVERERGAAAAIETNLQALGIGGQARILQSDAARLAANRGAPFDLVFLDPPYGSGLVEPALASLREGGWLEASALVVAERGIGDGSAPAEAFEPMDVRRWGAAQVSFLRQEI